VTGGNAEDVVRWVGEEEKGWLRGEEEELEAVRLIGEEDAEEVVDEDDDDDLFVGREEAEAVAACVVKKKCLLLLALLLRFAFFGVTARRTSFSFCSFVGGFEDERLRGLRCCEPRETEASWRLLLLLLLV
jgi:hypothetical protein